MRWGALAQDLRGGGVRASIQPGPSGGDHSSHIGSGGGPSPGVPQDNPHNESHFDELTVGLSLHLLGDFLQEPDCGSLASVSPGPGAERHSVRCKNERYKNAENPICS